MVAQQKPSGGTLTGRSPTTGTTFPVPPTRDMFQALLNPSCWGPSELVTLFFSFLLLLTVPLIPRVPYFFYVVQFLTWRLMYNGLLGVLLHVQSKSRAITRWLTSCSPSTHALLSWAVTRSLPDRASYDWSRCPPCFNAWLVYRALATVILTNDGLSYAVFFLATLYNTYFSGATSSSTLLSRVYLLLALPVAAALTYFSGWAKAAAHHVLSDFAWFWGDFFFTTDAKLSFDGVFKLVPHPMYTAGYAAYYAAALLARSHAFFQVSLIAHLSQLLFLALVEHPHIVKTYPPADKKSSGSISQQPLASTLATTSIEAETRITFELDFSDAAPRALFRATLAAVVAVAACIILFSWPSAPVVVLVGATLCARAAHWVVLTHQLSSSTTSGPRLLFPNGNELTSTARFTALTGLQHAQLLSSAFNFLLFLACVLRLSPARSLFALLWPASPAGRSALLLGAVLGALCAQGWYTALRDIGPFRATHGDLLLSSLLNSSANGSTSTAAMDEIENDNSDDDDGAVTRFLSRPLLVLPYGTLYATALAARSWKAIPIAIMLHVMHILFVRTTERTTKHYASPRATPLERKLLGMPCMAPARSQVMNAVDRTVDAVPQVAQNARVRVERVAADASKQREVTVRAFERIITDMSTQAAARAPDGTKCIEQLRSRGLKIAPVEPMVEE